MDAAIKTGDGLQAQSDWAELYSYRNGIVHDLARNWDLLTHETVARIQAFRQRIEAKNPDPRVKGEELGLSITVSEAPQRELLPDYILASNEVERALVALYQSEFLSNVIRPPKPERNEMIKVVLPRLDRTDAEEYKGLKKDRDIIVHHLARNWHRLTQDAINRFRKLQRRLDEKNPDRRAT